MTNDKYYIWYLLLVINHWSLLKTSSTLLSFLNLLLSITYRKKYLLKTLNFRFCKKNFEKILGILIIINKFAHKIPREEL